MIGMGLGCVIGLMINFGFAILAAYQGWSPWWLLLVALVANLFAQPFTHRYNLMRQAQLRGHLPATLATIWIVPALFGFGVQLAVYYLAAWLIN